MPASLEIFGASIVAVGAFNPPLLSLDWFSKNGLIGEGDADAARVRQDYVVARQISRFQTELAVVQAIESQLSVTAAGPVTPALADLVTSIFELLPHTPVTAVGLNFNSHYKIADSDTYHRIGDTLVPKKIWDSLFPDYMCGLADLTILVQEGIREQATAKSRNQKRVTVQPSTKVKPTGVYLQINNHFAESEDDRPLQQAASAAEIVKGHWKSCFDDSQNLFTRIIEMASAET